ncbi:MAG: DUF1638 domain-containing protein [Thomasclavelia sp.]|jgi:hypothetical protein|nr:DUF1638 domain-containing protein [Thomasclavelia sp.]
MIKIISCQIFEEYLNLLSLDQTRYDIEYLEIKQHLQPGHLSNEIQKCIHNSSKYELIILLYGLCGNMLLNIHSEGVPLLIMKVHDCLSILIGKDKYQELIKDDASITWTCSSLEHHGGPQITEDNYRQWVEEYGEDNALYLKDILIIKPKYYVDFEHSNIKNINILKGDLNILKNIIKGDKRYCLFLNENEEIRLTNDTEVIEKRNKE